MSVALPPDAEPGPPSEPAVGLWKRALLVFVNPAQAWGGLRAHAQWWFPLLLTILASSLTMLAVYERSYLPMMTEGLEQRVSEGQMQQQQLERTEAFFAGPAGRAINVGFQAVGLILVTLVTGLVFWMAGGFILGRPLGYRLALEGAAWSGLVTIPGFLVHNVLAYVQGVSVRDVHVGFGLLIPDPETPSRLVTGLRVFLDGLGPLAIWYVVVGILGLSALSGAPRKAAAWALGSLYLVLQVIVGAFAAMSTRGA